VKARSTVVLTLLALCAGVLAACGGSSGSSEDPQQVLTATFGGGKEVKSGRIAASIDLDAKGGNLNGPVQLKLDGPFESQGVKQLPKFDLNLSLSGGGQTLSAGAVSTGTAGYLKFSGQTYAVPADLFSQFRKGFEQSQSQSGKQGTTLSSLGVDPLKWLDNPQNKGTEDIAGTESIHIASDVDVPAFLADLDTIVKRAGSLGGGNVPSSITPQQRTAIQQAVKTATFDVWSGADDKILRKLELKLSFDVPQAQRQQAGGLESGDLRVTLQLSDIGKSQDVKVPTGAKPLSQLLSQLGGLGGLGALGGGSGSSGSGSSGSGSSGSGSAGDLDAYATCLEDAGGDTKKAQECASLLNG
jgi:hypothetical protein